MEGYRKKTILLKSIMLVNTIEAQEENTFTMESEQPFILKNIIIQVIATNSVNRKISVTAPYPEEWMSFRLKKSLTANVVDPNNLAVTSSLIAGTTVNSSNVNELDLSYKVINNSFPYPLQKMYLVISGRRRTKAASGADYIEATMTADVWIKN
jgi:hypothetical protein